MAKRYTRSTTTSEPVPDCLNHGDEEVMQALVMAGALVALADGRVDTVERDELVRYIDRQHLVPTISQNTIAEAFDSRVQQLEERHSVRAIAAALRPLAGISLASVVVRTAERVAAADLQIRPSELQALELIRLILRTPSGQKAAVASGTQFAEIVFFIVVWASAIATAGAIILAATSELPHSTGSQNAADVSPANSDNYLELFAKGPGRGWYVLPKAPCAVNEANRAGNSCERRPSNSTVQRSPN
jgi:tellurite resistance protein TerB